MAKKSELERVQHKVQHLVDAINAKIDALGKEADALHAALHDIQDTFGRIRNVPTEEALEYERLKRVRLEWRNQVEKIEKDYNEAVSRD